MFLTTYNEYKKEKTNNDLHFSSKIHLLKEDKNNDLVNGFPVNQKMKYDEKKMIQAIKNGMILLIQYKGEEDRWKGGRERVIYPMVLGVNKNTKNTLLRGWHFNGFSVRANKNVEREWRLFDVSNIKYMMFIGDFYRLPPKGYQMNDRHMTEKIIQRANFNEIRRNQNNLLKEGKIENEEETKLSNGLGVSKIRIVEVQGEIDLKNPWANPYLKPYQNKKEQIKVSILKSILGNDIICVVGAIGTINRTVKVYQDQILKGSFKTVEAFTGDEFNKHRVVKGVSILPLYQFEEKLK